MRILRLIRDFFWPILDRIKHKKSIETIYPSKIKLKDQKLNIAFELIIRNVEEEKERLRNIESKSTTFILILGLSITILFSFSKLNFQPAFQNEYTYVYNIIVFILLILILLYSFRSVFFAVKVLQRKIYFELDYKDLINCDDKKNYRKLIMSKIINNLNRNSKTINEKVDYLTLSQMYFLRAIFSILFLGLIIIINQLLYYLIS